MEPIFYCKYCSESKCLGKYCPICYGNMECYDEPTNAEIEAEIERQMQESEAKSDSM